jgi:RNA polymerase sigma factor (sigma-70 family)
MSSSLPPGLSGIIAPAADIGQESAWDEFLAGHSRLLMYVARSFGGDHDAAMDRYATLLEQLRRDDYRRMRAFADDGRSDFTTWLVVVAQRICLDHRRRRYGRLRGERTAEACEELRARRRLVDLVGVPLDSVEIAESDSTSADHKIVREETHSALADAMAHLSDHDRLLVELRFNDDLPMSRVASIVGYRTRFHAYRRLTRALESLRSFLTARGISRADG